MSTNSLDVAVREPVSSKGKFWLAVGLSFALMALLLLMIPVYATTTSTHARLNPDQLVGISTVRMSPDGNRVVYRAILGTPDLYELYSVAITGGSVIKLNESLVAGREVRNFIIAPDSMHVVYSADKEVDNRFDVYSVPIDGGTPMLLSTNLSTDTVAGLLTFASPVSSDSQRVVLTLEKIGTFRTYALASVPLGGGTLVTITPPLVDGGSIQNFSISNDGQFVVYRADQETDEVFELYAVPIAGGTATKLNLSLGANEDVVLGSPIRNNERILYRVEDGNGGRDLYSVVITGGVSAPLNPLSETVGYDGILSPDGTKLVFTTNEGSCSSGTGKYRLYISPVTGGGSTLLSTTNETDGSSSEAFGISFTPDGQTVIFQTRVCTNLSSETYAYSVSSAGGNKTKLVGPLDANAYAQMTKDGKRLLMTISRPFSNLPGALLSIDIDSASLITLTEPLNTNNGIISRLSEDDKRVIYHAKSGDFGAEIFSVPITGGVPVTINVPLTNFYSALPEYIGPVLVGSQECIVYGVGPLNSPFGAPQLYSSCVPSEIAVTPTSTATSTQTSTATTTPTPTSTPVPTVATATATPTKPAVYLPVVNR